MTRYLDLDILEVQREANKRFEVGKQDDLIYGFKRSFWLLLWEWSRVETGKPVKSVNEVQSCGLDAMWG